MIGLIPNILMNKYYLEVGLKQVRGQIPAGRKTMPNKYDILTQS